MRRAIHSRDVNYTLIPNLSDEVQIPENGILSRTLYNDDHVKILVFGFAAGQELSAHTPPIFPPALSALFTQTRILTSPSYLRFARPTFSFEITATTRFSKTISRNSQT